LQRLKTSPVNGFANLWGAPHVGLGTSNTATTGTIIVLTIMIIRIVIVIAIRKLKIIITRIIAVVVAVVVMITRIRRFRYIQSRAEGPSQVPRPPPQGRRALERPRPLRRGAHVRHIIYMGGLRS